ncbi:MAG: peptide-N-glycosidase F-related protein [Planctomycetota bacterium]|jgi:hypothetical protein
MPRILILLFVGGSICGGLARAEEADVAEFTATYAFDAPLEEAGITGTATGEAARRMPGPKRFDDKLYLLESWWKSSAAVGFPAPTSERVRHVEARWTLILNTGTEGVGFAWLATEAYGTEGAAPEVEAWEAPNLPKSFGVGFDASNPPNRDPFRGSGNVYDRPQHEVSLHFDGMEIVKRTTPMDFRDEEPHAVRLRLAFVVGGAEIDLWIDETAVYEGFFLPRMTAYVGRPAFGAHNAENAGDVLLDDVSFACREVVAAPEAPLTVLAIDHQLNDKAHPKHEATVTFPADTDAYGRIVATLRLDQPETRFDPWDRFAAVYAYDDGGERFEILRYITPYHRGHVWHVDVSAYRPLLRGERRIEQVCHTQGEGWVVTVEFAFYPGPADRYATHVVGLWSGKAVIGNPEKPLADFYVPRTVAVDETVEAAEVRLTVTGHGMAPNTNNAAEFMPIERTLTVNGEEFTNLLWKTDNYLNPCRPQGGTWKYDRAGWAPGDVVRPWVVDVTHLMGDGSLEIGYGLAPYVNEGRGRTWEPYHHTEAQVVLYRRRR